MIEADVLCIIGIAVTCMMGFFLGLSVDVKPGAKRIAKNVHKILWVVFLIILLIFDRIR